MKRFLAYLQLIRWLNLFIVFLTQALIWFCIIQPIGKENTLFLSPIKFLLLSLTTLLIAAAGYIINDYFDIDIDQINKPDKVIVGKFISKRGAVVSYVLLNALALFIAVYLADLLSNPFLPLIQVFCVMLLWAYAARLKREPVWGNVAVSLLTALTVLIVMAYEPALYSFLKLKGIRHTNSFLMINPLKLVFLYAYFAFMVTWMREIVKDIQDMEGDKAGGCRTLPILKGEKVAGYWLLGLFIIILLPLLEVVVALFHGKWIVLSLYIVLGLIFPLCSMIYSLLQKKSDEIYGRLSTRLKVIMLLGIFPLIIYYLLAYQW